MTAIPEEAVEAAIYAFAQFGIEFRAPWQCDLDDPERERYEALRAALAAAAPLLPQGEREGWRDIATATDQSAAPWDGVPVLICTNHNWGGDANRVHRAFWTDEIHGSGIFGWAVQDCKFGPYPLRGYTIVTHWMPLPPSPDGREGT